jgi:hypothetical protein
MAGRFLERLKQAREASATTEGPIGPKDPAAMSDEERDAEVARLEDEVRRAKIREIEAGRGQLGETTPRRRPSPFSGRRREPWK